MYVVMTTAELFQYAGFVAGIDGTDRTGVQDAFGWDGRNLETESTGISQSELDAFEICVPEHVARRMGILAPRGEFWISRAVEGDGTASKPGPKALPPKRPLPRKGEPVQLQLIATSPDQQDASCGHLEHEDRFLL